MINPVQTSVTQPDGTDRYLIIEPVIEKMDGDGLQATGMYKIYKDAFGDETHLFTEPAELTATENHLPDESNPDYLGTLQISDDRNFVYAGDLLSIQEQRELVEIIQRYEEPDI
jgi:hypothetical protein